MDLFKKRKKKNNLLKKTDQTQVEGPLIFSDMNDNLTYIKNLLNHTADLKIQTLPNGDFETAIVFIETLVDKELIQDKIIDPLFQLKSFKDREDIATVINLETISCSNLSQAVNDLINGNTLLFVSTKAYAFSINTQKFGNRSITEPSSEKVVRGAHDGFIESLGVNIQLIRKRILNPNLTVKYFSVGNETKTKVALLYMNKLANTYLIREIERRIDSISADFIMPSSYLEELIEDSSFSPFPQMLNTERPDRTMANLLEGRVVLLVDNTPTALILPVTFFSFYQSPDDYNSRFFLGTFFRIVRLLSFSLAVGLPSLYIAIIAFHYEVLPDQLILPVKSSVENIPFPPLLEALIMLITIELIQEAGIRLPTTIGQTIGIVGGLVIGDAVVSAGLISNTMLVVVAITAISSFVVPSTEMSGSMRIIRFPFMLAAATLGFIGIVFCFMVILIHLCKLESFGTPYFAPLAPLRITDFKDSILRLPIWKLNNRPLDPHPQQLKQQSNSRDWGKDDEK
ncbi:spore germination protein [Neobacillus sp.]|uniref:spore germination protein n=1 Tax=Neobacillus sp. TaxID=2675273 RepID=UPI0028A05514|nr:spore germination protein [Neobacillus sp.]